MIAEKTINNNNIIFLATQIWDEDGFLVYFFASFFFIFPLNPLSLPLSLSFSFSFFQSSSFSFLPPSLHPVLPFCLKALICYGPHQHRGCRLLHFQMDNPRVTILANVIDALPCSQRILHATSVCTPHTSWLFSWSVSIRRSPVFGLLEPRDVLGVQMPFPRGTSTPNISSSPKLCRRWLKRGKSTCPAPWPLGKHIQKNPLRCCLHPSMLQRSGWSWDLAEITRFCLPSFLPCLLLLWLASLPWDPEIPHPGSACGEPDLSLCAVSGSVNHKCLWPPDAENQLIGKDPDTGKDWRQEEKGTTEDEMVGWHHRLYGHEFEQAPGVGNGQGGLVCCSPRGRKESDTREQLNNKAPAICLYKDYIRCCGCWLFNTPCKQLRVERRQEASVFWEKVARQVFRELDIFRSWFYACNSCISSYLEMH